MVVVVVVVVVAVVKMYSSLSTPLRNIGEWKYSSSNS
jgi:hypothetical protein